jgi:hypothetical protein
MGIDDHDEVLLSVQIVQAVQPLRSVQDVAQKKIPKALCLRHADDLSQTRIDCQFQAALL